MILNCPSCRAKYLVQIGLFARGGRQVRCARCKYEWHATLPTHIDVFGGAEDKKGHSQPHAQETASSSLGFSRSPATSVPPGLAATSPNFARSIPNLPVAVSHSRWQKYVNKVKYNLPLLAKIAAAGFFILIWPIFDRQQIVVVFPSLRTVYERVGLHINHSGTGLIFDGVKSELRYDSGVMKLYVDGTIHNMTNDMQFIPEIKALAMGPDKHVILSWWVEAPAATVAAGSDVAFHTEIEAPMQHTIEKVYLEFISQGEKSDVHS